MPAAWARWPTSWPTKIPWWPRPESWNGCGRSRRLPRSILSDARLVRLASVASQHAAVSSRQELYPRGMPAARAIRLSHGALNGLRMLSVAQVRERVAGRYPEAAPLPDRPAARRPAAGSRLRLPLGAGRQGRPGLLRQQRTRLIQSPASEPTIRYPTTPGLSPVGEVTPEEADARQFEERLQRAVAEGSFLSLLVQPEGLRPRPAGNLPAVPGRTGGHGGGVPRRLAGRRRQGGG